MSKPALASASAVSTPSAEAGARFLQGARRLLLAVGGLSFSLAATFFGLLFITFVIGRLMPVDPVLAAVGDRASQATYNQVKEAMGLNLPIWHQFARYAWNVLHADFGMSTLTAHPVLEDLIRVFPATAEMATVVSITTDISTSRQHHSSRFCVFDVAVISGLPIYKKNDTLKNP